MKEGDGAPACRAGSASSAARRGARCTERADGEANEIDGRAVFELEMVPEKGAPDTWFVDVATVKLAPVGLGCPTRRAASSRSASSSRTGGRSTA